MWMIRKGITKNVINSMIEKYEKQGFKKLEMPEVPQEVKEPIESPISDAIEAETKEIVSKMKTGRRGK